MKQELPLTPAMIDYARSSAFRKGMGSTSWVGFVLVLCFIAPAFFTVALFLRHRPVGLGVAVLWIACGLLFCGFIYLGLKGARLVRRDLAGGVYVRGTGPFSTRLYNIDRFEGFVVHAGGRELSSDMLPPPPIGDNNGTVDYLPASNVLCEVRNEQGAVLWSLFDTTGTH
jgi:hypothetical protein